MRPNRTAGRKCPEPPYRGARPIGPQPGVTKITAGPRGCRGAQGRSRHTNGGRGRTGNPQRGGGRGLRRGGGPDFPGRLPRGTTSNNKNKSPAPMNNVADKQTLNNIAVQAFHFRKTGCMRGGNQQIPPLRKLRSTSNSILTRNKKMKGSGSRKYLLP